VRKDNILEESYMKPENESYVADAEMTPEERTAFESDLYTKGREKYGLDEQTAREWAHDFAWGTKKSSNGNGNRDHA